jgi:hypothetical protein
VASEISSSRFGTVLSAVPWVLYFTLGGFGQPALAVIAGLAVVVYATIAQVRRGQSLKMPDWVTLAFFAIGTVSMTLGATSRAYFSEFSGVLVWVLFAGAAWTSIMIGAPFTLQYARESSPPEHWENPIFIRTNVLLTLMWASVFTFNLVVAIVTMNPSGSPPAYAYVVQTATTIGAAVFTARYSAMVRRRAIAGAAVPQ